MIKRFLAGLGIILLSLQANASDSLIVKLNQQAFQKGDTLDFTCTVTGLVKSGIVATLNVVIEDINKNKRWKFRYPLINGEASGDLIIKDLIADGVYAVNFVVQNSFFHVEGEIKDYKPKQKSLSYFVIGKNKTSYMDIVTPAANGSFRLKSMFFEDTAYFVFSPAKKKETDYLWIDIKTPLD